MGNIWETTITAYSCLLFWFKRRKKKNYPYKPESQLWFAFPKPLLFFKYLYWDCIWFSTSWGGGGVIIFPLLLLVKKINLVPRALKACTVTCGPLFCLHGVGVWCLNHSEPFCCCCSRPFLWNSPVFLLLHLPSQKKKEEAAWEAEKLVALKGTRGQIMSTVPLTLKGAGLTALVLSNDNFDSLHFKSHAQMVPSEALWVIVAFWGYDISGWNSIREIHFQLSPWNRARQAKQYNMLSKKIGPILFLSLLPFTFCF